MPFICMALLTENGYRKEKKMGHSFIGNDKHLSLFKIDNPEKAYTLGFMWGDAHMHRTKKKDGTYSDVTYPTIEIVKTDMDQLQYLFEVWGNWGYYCRSRAGRREQAILSLCNKEFGWFLTKNDYITKSYSEPTKILSTIPEELQCYWWRGYIDADGCFYRNDKEYLRQFSLAGTYEQTWNEASSLFDKLGIAKHKAVHRIQSEKSRSSIIRITNRREICLLGAYIYADRLDIGLKRKQEKYQLIVQS